MLNERGSYRRRMRAERERFRRTATWIAMGVASATLILFGIIHLITKKLDISWMAIPPLTIFSLFLLGAYWYYDKTWANRNRNRSLNGTWGYHVRDEKGQQEKIGFIRIEHDDFGLQIRDGASYLIQNDFPQKETRHFCNAELCTFDERRLLLLFQVTAQYNDPAGGLVKNQKYEFFWLLERAPSLDKPPYKLTGFFAETKPENPPRKGTIVMRWIDDKRINSITGKTGDDWRFEIVKLAFADWKSELAQRENPTAPNIASPAT